MQGYREYFRVFAYDDAGSGITIGTSIDRLQLRQQSDEIESGRRAHRSTKGELYGTYVEAAAIVAGALFLIALVFPLAPCLSSSS